MVGCSGPDHGPPREEVAPETRRSPSADSILGKNAQFSCIEEATVKTLAKRSWAFDGTVINLIPPRDEHGEENPEDIFARVTFKVNRWYKGSGGDTVTLLADYAPVGQSSVEEAETPVGTRILGSGEGDHLWPCGFSMEYTPKNARLFERAFSRES